MIMTSKSSTLALAVLATLIPHAGHAQQHASLDRFVGTWTGAIAPNPTIRLHLALTVTRDASDGLVGVMTSLDQGNAKIPATFRTNGDTLVVAMPAVHASYTGVLGAANDSLRGSFTQGTTMPLDMGRVVALPVPDRPQEPKPPFPYRETAVSFESVPGVRLACTITMPFGAGPFPAVVMVTGSGAQDRNEALLGHKPFLVITDYLARHGIAALRCDDRGTAKSTGNFAAGTSADFANDAEASVRYLRAQPGIDRDHVGMLGHSEGGLIAPMVAARSADVAFIVLLAGPGLPGDSILLMQGKLIALAAGTPAGAVEQTTETNRRLFAALKTGTDLADGAARVLAVEKTMVAALTPEQQSMAAKRLDAVNTQLFSPWMRYFITYDPRPALRKVRVPVLAMDGALDLQVPPGEDLAAIAAALKEGGNHDYRIVELPKLNHLFQTAATGSPAEYAQSNETFSPAALEIIADWINAHARAKPNSHRRTPT